MCGRRLGRLSTGVQVRAKFIARVHALVCTYLRTCRKLWLATYLAAHTHLLSPMSLLLPTEGTYCTEHKEVLKEIHMILHSLSHPWKVTYSAARKLYTQLSCAHECTHAYMCKYLVIAANVSERRHLRTLVEIVYTRKWLGGETRS